VTSILLVEDDDQLRVMLTTLLTSTGYEVWEAPNGRGVCDLYRQHDFDLVITDLVMPEIEGLGMITELQRINHNVRIIAMSGGGQGGRQAKAEEYLLLAEKLGAQLTLTKPFDNQEFLDAVRLVLETQGHRYSTVDAKLT
jgi:DNA-binding response OmpR family regulator